MKKSLALVLAMVMLTLLFAGCGTAQQAAPATAAPAEAAPAEAAPAEAAPADAATAETKHIVFAFNRSLEDVVGRALLAASDKLYEDTNGKYDFTLYPNGTYATNLECMQAVILGDLDATCFDSGMDYATRLGILQVPFTFTGGYDHWLAFKDSELYQEYLNDFNETVGIHQFGFYTFGLRYVTGNEIWTTPDELKDVKLRVATLAPYSEYGLVLGCNAAPLEATELYVALQNGVFDAEENSLADIVSRKFFEVQKYIIGTKHALSCGGFGCSQKLWDSLDADSQKALTDAFNFAIDYIDDETINQESETIKWLEEQGCEYVEVDDVTPFVERMPLLFDKYPEFEDYWTKIQEVEY